MTDFRPFAEALRQLLSRPKIRQRFMKPDTVTEVADELRIPHAMIQELRNVLEDVANLSALGSETSDEEGTATRIRDETLDSMDQARQFLDNSFAQLRTAFRLSLAMSLAVFVVGLGFLVIAAIRTFTHPAEVGTTAVVAGVGVVQIVALFYRNPLRDVGRAVSNAQQSKMAVMSYMLGISLVGESVYHGKPTEDAGRRLTELTRGAIEQLERFAEDPGSRDGNQKRDS